MAIIAQQMFMEDWFEAVIEVAKEKFEEYKEVILEGLIKAFTQVVGKAAFNKIFAVCFSVVKSRNKVFILIRDKLENIKAWVNKNRKIIVSAVCSVVADRLADWFIKHLGTGMVALGAGAFLGGTLSANVAMAATVPALPYSLITSMIVMPVLPIMPVMAAGAAVGVTAGVGVAQLFGRGKDPSRKLHKFQGKVISLL